MDAMTNDFGEVLLWSFWFFIWIAALMVWFRCLWDLFSDHSLSGWAKAGWAILLIFVPWLGALIYAQDKYIQEVASTSKSPADEIARAKDLLDSGTITQEEYDSLKAKALA